eukprot:2997194-Prymnesium_polylepis.1
MEADHPAKRLRVRVAARLIAACSSNVSAPRGRRIPAVPKAVHPAREQRDRRAIRISTTGCSGAPCLVLVVRPRAPRAMHSRERELF